jgi:hypothetical protein
VSYVVVVSLGGQFPGGRPPTTGCLEGRFTQGVNLPLS